MIGAPLQQRRTDKDCKLGYWKLYSDLSMEFIELKGFPNSQMLNPKMKLRMMAIIIPFYPRKLVFK